MLKTITSKLLNKMYIIFPISGHKDMLSTNKIQNLFRFVYIYFYILSKYLL